MEILTVKEAAKMLRCTRQTLYDKVATNEIPHFRLGENGHIRFERDALFEWTRKQTHFAEGK